MNLDRSCILDDKKIWDTKGMEVRNTLNNCGKSCWGASKCTEDCMKKEEGFSQQCAECFGKFSECGKYNCKWKCWFDTLALGCIKCVNKYCVESFIKCSGLSSPIQTF